MNEIFVEIKRRYDFAARQEQEDEQDRFTPARQFWGCGVRWSKIPDEELGRWSQNSLG